MGKTMNAKTVRYTEGPIREVRKVKDFLPSPDQLVFRQDSVKVTLSLSKSSVDFFKKIARLNNGKYQQMIRQLIDSYVEHHRSQP